MEGRAADTGQNRVAVGDQIGLALFVHLKAQGQRSGAEAPDVGGDFDTIENDKRNSGGEPSLSVRICKNV